MTNEHSVMTSHAKTDSMSCPTDIHSMASIDIGTHLKQAASAKVLIDTAQQVNEQRAIVLKLRQRNAEYLDSMERSWIDHILQSANDKIKKVSYLTEPVAEKPNLRRKWRLDHTFFDQMKQLITEAPLATDDLTQLLIVAQSLSSAIGLLSSCYERWNFSCRCNSSTDLNLDNSVDELSQLMNRRRHNSDERLDRLIRLALVCLNQSQSMGQQNRTTDDSNGQHNSISSHSACTESTQLSLIVIESVDKWRQNAEDALKLNPQEWDQNDGQDNEIFTAVDDDIASEDAVLSTARKALIINARAFRCNIHDRGVRSEPPKDNQISNEARSSADDRANPRSRRPSSCKGQTVAYSTQLIRRKPLPGTQSLHVQSTPNQCTLYRPYLSTNHPRSVSTPCLRDSFDKEPSTDDNVAQRPKKLFPLTSSPRDTNLDFNGPGHPDLSISSVSHCSSTPSLRSEDKSTISQNLCPNPSEIQPQWISRGRAWLERQAEGET